MPWSWKSNEIACLLQFELDISKKDNAKSGHCGYN
jgi:hypothetical protein